MDKRVKLILLAVSVMSVVFFMLYVDNAGKDSVRTKVKLIAKESRDRKPFNKETSRVTSTDQLHVRRSPLCRMNTTITIFGTRMFSVPLIPRSLLHKREVEICKLPDEATTCLLTTNTQYYQIADVLYITPCFTQMYTEPAYPEQLVLTYNRGPEKKRCNDPKQMKWSVDVRVSYTSSSTIPFPFICMSDMRQPLLDALKLKPPTDRHGIVMVVTDCSVRWRYNYLKELMKYVHIDSYGKCLHNTNMSSSRSKGQGIFASIKLNIIKSNRYKYLICFENNVLSEYVSEKLWHAYMSQTIPIYYGAPEAYHQAPGNNTFIDASKFAGPKELAEYIKKVDQNESLYKSYFNFDINRPMDFQKSCPPEPVGCAVCKKLYDLREQRCRQ